MDQATQELMETLVNALYEAEEFIVGHPAHLWRCRNSAEVIQTINDALSLAEAHGLQNSLLCYARQWDGNRTQVVAAG